MKIAVGQITSTSCWKTNLKTCIELLERAAQQRATCLFLPEASDYIAETKSETLSLATDLESSEFVNGIRHCAQKLGIWVSVGVHEKSQLQTDSSRIHNTHILIDGTDGTIRGKYQKVHLFDCDAVNLKESDTTIAGDVIPKPIATPFGKVGLGICYDVRFPEQALMYRSLGADILTYPSAFTMKTGQAHWELLLRARAIDAQCYVIGAAQVGKHNAKRESYGHAMVVDPWGTVLAEITENASPSIAVADIDLDRMVHVRKGMPILLHRRKDLYNAI